MLPNGLLLIVDRAVSELGDPMVERYREAFALGALREDVRRVPVVDHVYEHLSFTHLSGRWLPGGFIPLLWPGPQMMADRFFGEAVAEGRAGRFASAFVRLGRVSHILSDMACPCHANRVIHETDPYEWHIESHVEELRSLPLPPVPAARRASDLTLSLAAESRRFAPDGTHSAIGRVLRRVGLRKPLPRSEAARQASILIPLAVSHTISLLRLFRSRAWN